MNYRNMWCDLRNVFPENIEASLNASQVQKLHSLSSSWVATTKAKSCSKFKSKFDNRRKICI